MVKAFLYIEAQVSIPHTDFPWQEDNSKIREEEGLISKTWLSGTDNNSVGGFYTFDSVENAKKYANGFMAEKAKELDICITTRVFSANRFVQANKEMNSPFY
ncbi:MAG TPA: hypothetical protein ENK39_04090 [Epsilonproteobacteria bacterium]|nr:hypothetical protein [Campylobacterota bacterium]